MKPTQLLAAVALSVLVAAFAVAAPTRAADRGMAGLAKDHAHKKTARSSRKGSCQSLELRPATGAGTVTLIVTGAHKGNSSLVGKRVTLPLSTGASLNARVCQDASGTLTLHSLRFHGAKHRSRSAAS